MTMREAVLILIDVAFFAYIWVILFLIDRFIIDVACVAYTKRKRQREGDKDA